MMVQRDGVLRTMGEQIHPEHTALVVVDVQNDFIHPEGWYGKDVYAVLMASDSVLPNWSAKMSDHGDINVDAERTGKTSGAQQPAGRAYDYGPGGDSNGSEHTPHQAHPGGLP